MALPKRIDFNPALFNDVYWHLEKDFCNPDLRFIFLYGGSSASKTYTVVQKLITTMLTGAHENTLVLRKYATDIKDSIYSDFKGIISEWGLNDYFILQQNYIQCVSGSYIRFRGLDDSEKVKGISNFKRVLLEEISQFEEVDFKQIRKRLRGKANQQIIGIFNPISEDHWLKTNLFDSLELEQVPVQDKISGKWISKKGNSVVYKLTYLDNKYIVGPHFIDQHTIDDFEHDKLHDYAYYLVYALGEWGKLRTGGEVYKKFSTAKHVSVHPYDPELPIHLTFDFNVNPYMTAIACQLVGKDLKIINEFCLSDPQNRTSEVCKQFERTYYAHDKGLFIYGDPSGKAQDTRSEKGYNDFRIIEQYLVKYRPQLRVASKAPPVVMRMNFINAIFDFNFENISIGIDSRCKETIKDFSSVLEASDGTKDKKKEKNPVTGITFEKWGHVTDAMEYLICQIFSREFDIYQRGKSPNKAVIKQREYNSLKGY